MATSRTSVYLVDDDDMYLKTANHTLSQNRGLDLKMFSSGEELLKELKKKKKYPDVVILDYFLNSENTDAISGIEVLKQLKSMAKRTEVIMLSGQDDMDVAVNSVKYGAFDYVVKNKSAFIRVQNDIKRISSFNRNKRENKTLRNFLLAFSIAAGIIGGFALIMKFKPELLGVTPKNPNQSPQEQVDDNKQESSDERTDEELKEDIIEAGEALETIVR